MVEIKIDISDELLKFVDKLIEKGTFSSRKEFFQHAIRLLAELYGYTPISLIDKLVSKLIEKKTPSMPTELSEEERNILLLFRESTFLYPEEIWARAIENAYITGTKPPTKEKVYELIDKLVKKGFLERIKRNGETLIKILRKVD